MHNLSNLAAVRAWLRKNPKWLVAARAAAKASGPAAEALGEALVVCEMLLEAAPGVSAEGQERVRLLLDVDVVSAPGALAGFDALRWASWLLCGGAGYEGPAVTPREVHAEAVYPDEAGSVQILPPSTDGEGRDLRLGARVRFEGPGGSTGTIKSVSPGGPHPFYVEWQYGLDARGEPMRSTSACSADQLAVVSEADWAWVATTPGFGPPTEV